MINELLFFCLYMIGSALVTLVILYTWSGIKSEILLSHQTGHRYRVSEFINDLRWTGRYKIYRRRIEREIASSPHNINNRWRAFR